MQSVKEKAAGAAPGVLVPGMQFPYPYAFPPHFPQQAPKEKKGKKEKKRGRKEKRERSSSDESSKEVSSKRSSCSSSSSGSSGSKRKKKRRRKKRKKKEESESSASSDEEGRRRAAAAAAAVGAREPRRSGEEMASAVYDSRGDPAAGKSKAVKEESKESEEKVAMVPAKQEPLEKPEKAKAALAKKGAVAAKSKAKPAAVASKPRQQLAVKEELGREEAFQPPERIEALDMPRELMGHIVGKAGAIIKAICQESGAQVDAFDAAQDPVRVLVSGSWEAVEEARVMLLEVAESVAIATGNMGLAVKAATTAPGVLLRPEAPVDTSAPAKPQGPLVQEHLELPYHATGKIIGTRGQQISEVRAKSGAQVDVDKTSNGLCRVRMLGTQEQVQLAKSMISKITDPGGEGEFMEISRSAVGRIIGAGGARIQELQERSGVKIDIDRATEPCLVRFAGSPENVAYAKQLVVEVLEGRDKTTLGEAVVNIDVPPSCTGRLIGPGGRQINEIQETSGAKVDIDKSTDPCVVRMTGSHENVAKAEAMVRAVLQAIGRGRPLLGRATTDEETINFDVPTAVAAHLLGDGAWLRAVEMRTGAKAFLRQQADGTYMLELSGLPEQVVEAEQLAEEAVRSISAASTAPAIAPGARKLVRPPAPPQLEMGVVSKAAAQPWLPVQPCPQPWLPALPAVAMGQTAAEQVAPQQAAVQKVQEEAQASQTPQKTEAAPVQPAVEPAAQPPAQPAVEGVLPAPPPPAQLTEEAGAEAKPQLHMQAPTEQLPQPPPPPGPPPASNPTWVAWPAPVAPQPIFAAWPGTVPIPLVAAPWMGCAVPAFAPQ